MIVRHRITTWAVTSLGAAAVGLAMATAGHAAASSVDDTFLAQISSAGIAFSSAQGAVSDGHQVCDELGDGGTGVSVATEIMANTDLTTRQAATFVVAAAGAYCPQYADQLNA